MVALVLHLNLTAFWLVASSLALVSWAALVTLASIRFPSLTAVAALAPAFKPVADVASVVAFTARDAHI